jgi:hypothetical protein
MKRADDLEEYPSGEEEITGRCEGSSIMAVLRGGRDLRQGVRGNDWRDEDDHGRRIR